MGEKQRKNPYSAPAHDNAVTSSYDRDRLPRYLGRESQAPEIFVGGASALTLFGRSLVRRLCWWIVFVVLGSPVPSLCVFRSDGSLWKSWTMHPGQSVVTEYRHSVEQTQVRDTFRVVGGGLWSWETVTRSQNAGLPVDAGLWGRYRFQERQQLFQGMRQRFRNIVWRIGRGDLGRNILKLPDIGWEETVFLTCPGERLKISVVWRILGWGGWPFLP